MDIESTIQMPKLKPCPFCGGKGQLYVADGGIRVVCKDCQASTVAYTDGWSTKGVTGNATKAVMERWNRRVQGG